MNINVDSLNNGFSKEVEFEGNITLPESLVYNKDVYIQCKGTITNSYGKYTFNGNIIAKVTFNCNLCLKQFEKEIAFDMLEVFSKDSTDNDEIWIFSSKDNIIKLEEPIKTNLLLNLPMKALCSENCKGLCHICGHNLNDSDCGCDRDYIDPRFEKFLHLFENKEV